MVEWNGTVISTTPRLILRTFREDDLPVYAALNAHPEVVRWLGGEPLTREHSDAIAEWAQELYAEEGIGLLAVERRSDVEIAWRLAYEHWGKGYATEAATGWLDLAFGPLGLDRVISITDPPNVRSLVVMRHLGMTFDHEARVEDEGVLFDAVVYAITATAWRLR